MHMIIMATAKSISALSFNSQSVAKSVARNVARSVVARSVARRESDLKMGIWGPQL